MYPTRFEHESRGPERRVAPHARNVSHLSKSGDGTPVIGERSEFQTELACPAHERKFPVDIE